MRRRSLIAVIFASTLLFSATASAASSESLEWQTMKVAASAYNSLAAQTKAQNEDVAAWGDVLKPGMRAIAVSHDLIEKGLTHGTKVRIEGLPGVYTVLDKMAARWKNKIDIYMGRNRNQALSWGLKKNIRIHYAGQ